MKLTQHRWPTWRAYPLPRPEVVVERRRLEPPPVEADPYAAQVPMLSASPRDTASSPT